MKSNSHILVSTRKGLMVYEKVGSTWQFNTCHFEAIPVTLAFVDERNNNWWVSLDHGHWGVKLHKSSDRGQNWVECNPPTYPEGEIVKDDILAKTEYIWAMTGGGVDYPERLWLGTIPGGLFKSEDGGNSWELNQPLWNEPSRKEIWFGGGFDHPGIHSIVVDPADSNHLYIGISCAGVFETYDGGQSWEAKNKGLFADFLPDPHADIGHDPHMMFAVKSQPNVMWQQNHCGIFKSSDGAASWQEVGKKGTVAHFGFAIAVDHHNPDVAWTAPAVSDEYRVAVNNALCICRTDDGGQSWKELRNGLPQENCYDIVYRHALATNNNTVVFGTTTGNLFISDNRGDEWKVLSHHLPMVHAVTFG